MQPDSVLGEVKMKTDEVAHWEGNPGEAEAYVCDVVYRVGTVKSHACVECLAGLQVPPDTKVSAPPQTGRSRLISLAAKKRRSPTHGDLGMPEDCDALDGGRHCHHVLREAAKILNTLPPAPLFPQAEDDNDDDAEDEAPVAARAVDVLLARLPQAQAEPSCARTAS